MSTPIHGHCDPAFASVQTAFENNFAEHGEVGASVCVTVDGEEVVDLWGGYQGSNKQKEWESDTVTIVFSCTKAAVALCAQLLIDRGQLKLDEKVSTYWPEFAQNGKENVTVRMMLNHSAGLPALRDPVKPGGFYDFDYMTQRLAAEEPFWEPGTKNGYHMVTFGWTVGELVRRVSGKSLGAFFADEIARPFGIDLHIGMDEVNFHRVARMIPFAPGADFTPTEFVTSMLSNPQSVQFLSLMNTGSYFFDAAEAWKAEIGGGGGIGNGRALAKMFAALLKPEGEALLSKARIEDMRKPSMETERDETLLIPTRFGQGFMLTMDNREKVAGEGNSAILGAGAFGHVGMGGSIGIADPEAKMSLGYSMIKMGGGIMLNTRGQALVDAAYQSLGYKEIRGGAWRK